MKGNLSRHRRQEKKTQASAGCYLQGQRPNPAAAGRVNQASPLTFSTLLFFTVPLISCDSPLADLDFPW